MKADISSYLRSHGVSLRVGGTSERGFTQREIFELLELLSESHLPPLGLEVWRSSSGGEFRIDSLAGWVPSSSLSFDESFAEVKKVVAAEIQRAPSVFTLQF